MACICVKKNVGASSNFVTIRKPPFGKMNKSVEQLFVCFLAAAESYRAPGKELEVAGNRSMSGSYTPIFNDDGASNTIFATSKDRTAFDKYLGRIKAIVSGQDPRVPFNSVSRSKEI